MFFEVYEANIQTRFFDGGNRPKVSIERNIVDFFQKCFFSNNLFLSFTLQRQQIRTSIYLVQLNAGTPYQGLRRKCFTTGERRRRSAGVEDRNSEYHTLAFRNRQKIGKKSKSFNFFFAKSSKTSALVGIFSDACAKN